MPRLDYSYRSKVYATEFNHEETAQDGYSLWNARVTLRPQDGPWSFSVFGNNLTDEHYFALVSESQGGAASGVYGAPRTYGVELGLRF